MKTYKLLKLYPSLPLNWEAGMIMEEIGANSYAPQDKKYASRLLRKQTVETNPEYWQEVIKANVVGGWLRILGKTIKIKTIDTTFSDIKIDLENDILSIFITPNQPQPEIIKPSSAPPLPKEPLTRAEQFLEKVNNAKLQRFEDAKLRILNGNIQKFSDAFNITPENTKQIKAALQNYKNYWIGDNIDWVAGWWSEGRQEMYIDGEWSNIADYKRIVLKPIQKPN